MPTKKAPEMIIEQTTDNEERSALFVVVRKVVLASIGAIALAQEEIEDFVGRLIERGEIAEQDGRKLLHEVMDKRKEETNKAKDEAQKAKSRVSKQVESVKVRMTLPSKAEVDALNEKIDELSKAIDELETQPVTPPVAD